MAAVLASPPFFRRSPVLASRGRHRSSFSDVARPLSQLSWLFLLHRYLRYSTRREFQSLTRLMAETQVEASIPVVQSRASTKIDVVKDATPSHLKELNRVEHL